MPAQAQSKPSRLHESSKVALKPILWCLAGFLATALLIHSALIGYGLILRSIHKGFGHIYQLQLSQIPHYPAPAPQNNPQVDLQAYRSRAEQDLNTYGWIDQTHGIVKIPVERAMERLAAGGVPVRLGVQDGPSELDMQTQKAAAAGPSIAPPQPGQNQP
jgi:hypothetical protein